jgi:hypothetical protein
MRSLDIDRGFINFARVYHDSFVSTIDLNYHIKRRRHHDNLFAPSSIITNFQNCRRLGDPWRVVRPVA